ncbi:hypothetical protein, partial [Frankia sp. CiP3]|uniref:hypothetical protein n=1 Tax=Frankia sp. CiP3 TaxID=2880971 RepID=UPI001EF6DD76
PASTMVAESSGTLVPGGFHGVPHQARLDDSAESRSGRVWGVAVVDAEDPAAAAAVGRSGSASPRPFLAAGCTAVW